MKASGDETIARNPKLLWLLVIATLPAGVIGLLFEKQAEAAGNNLYMIGTWSILMGLFMLWQNSGLAPIATAAPTPAGTAVETTHGV